MIKMFALAALILSVCSSVSFAQNASPYMTEPSLSPDRKEIAFVSGGDIWSVPAEAGSPGC